MRVVRVGAALTASDIVGPNLAESGEGVLGRDLEGADVAVVGCDARPLLVFELLVILLVQI